MSADNWTHCPACTKRKKDELARDWEEHDALYGTQDVSEWVTAHEELKRRTAELDAENHDESRTCTFREDYEIYGANEGTVYVSYSGFCKECKTTVKFKVTFPFFPEAAGDSEISVVP